MVIRSNGEVGYALKELAVGFGVKGPPDFVSLLKVRKEKVPYIILLFLVAYEVGVQIVA